MLRASHTHDSETTATLIAGEFARRASFVLRTSRRNGGVNSADLSSFFGKFSQY